VASPHDPSFWGVAGSLVHLAHDIALEVDESFRRLIVQDDEVIESDEPIAIRETYGSGSERRARGLTPFIHVPTACRLIQMLLESRRGLLTSGANVLRINDSLVKIEFHFGESRKWRLSATEPSQMKYPPGQIKFIEPA